MVRRCHWLRRSHGAPPARDPMGSGDSVNGCPSSGARFTRPAARMPSTVPLLSPFRPSSADLPLMRRSHAARAPLVCRSGVARAPFGRRSRSARATLARRSGGLGEPLARRSERAPWRVGRIGGGPLSCAPEHFGRRGRTWDLLPIPRLEEDVLAEHSRLGTTFSLSPSTHSGKIRISPDHLCAVDVSTPLAQNGALIGTYRRSHELL